MKKKAERFEIIITLDNFGSGNIKYIANFLRKSKNVL